MTISRFGFEDLIWVLIAPVPDHCSLVTFKEGRALSPFLGLPRMPRIKSYCTTHFWIDLLEELSKSFYFILIGL